MRAHSPRRAAVALCLAFLALLPFHRPVITTLLGPRAGFAELLFVPMVVLLVLAWRRRPPREGLLVMLVVAVGFIPSVLGAIDAGRAGAQLLVLLYVAGIYTAGLTLAAMRERDAGLRALVLGAAAASALGIAGTLLDALGLGGHGFSFRYALMDWSPRPLGPTESPSMLALIALGGWLAAAKLRSAARLRRRSWLLLGGLFGSTLLLSQSRVLLAALVGIGLLLAIRRRTTRSRRWAGLAMCVLGVAATVATLTWRIIPYQAQWPFLDTRPSMYWVCHDIAWRTFASEPLSGVGLESFHAAWPAHYEPARHDPAFAGGAEHMAGRPRDPHGTVQGYLAEAGVPALLVLAALGYLLWRRRDPQSPEFTAFLGALAVLSLSVDLLTERSTWALLALLGSAPAAPGRAILRTRTVSDN